MGFTWTKFGIMAPPQEDAFYLYAVNTDGSKRKLSKRTYPTAPAIKQKCISLIGHPTVIRTSQNTANWSTSEWFSDISLDDTNTGNLSITGSDKVIEDVDSLLNKIDAIVEQKVSASSQRTDDILKAQINSISQAQLEAAHERIRSLEAKINEMEANERTDKAINLAKSANKRASEAEEQLKEKEKLIEQLQEERQTLPIEQKKSSYEEQKALQQHHDSIIGNSHRIRVKGHPARTLLLRTGVKVRNDSIDLKILEHLDGNAYVAEISGTTTKVILILGFNDRNGLFAYTFKNIDHRWFEEEKRITGLNENILKNRLDITDEELLDHFEKVRNSLELPF